MKRPTLKQRRNFEQQADKLLLEVGAARLLRRYPWPEYVLNTRAGLLTLSVFCGLDETGALWHHSGAPYVCSRFRDVDAAHEFTDCNPFSGKWNFHCWNDWDDLEYGLRRLRYELVRVRDVGHIPP